MQKHFTVSRAPYLALFYIFIFILIAMSCFAAGFELMKSTLLLISAFGTIFMLLAKRVPLGAPKPEYPFIHWIARVIACYLVFGLVSIAMLVTWVGGGPALLDQAYPFDQALDSIISFHQHTFFTLPFFLWGAVTATNMILIYKNGEPSILNLNDVYRFVPAFFVPWAKRFAAVCYIGFHLSIGVMLVLTSVMLFQFVLQRYWLNIHHFYYPLLSGALASLFIPVVARRRSWMKALWRAQERNGWHYRKLFILSWVFFSLILVLLNLANAMAIKEYQGLYDVWVLNAINRIATVQPLSVRFDALYLSWLVITIPVVANYLTSISKGRTIRGVFFVTCLMPFSTIICFQYFSEHPILWRPTPLILQLIMIGLSMVCFTTACFMMGLKKKASHLVSVFLPDIPSAYVTKHALSRISSVFLQVGLFIICGHALIGWTFLQVLAYMGALTGLYQLLWTAISWFYLIDLED